jgi:shikimate kinase
VAAGRPEVLARRVRRATTGPPRDDPLAALRRLDAERRPLYEEVADLVVDVDDLSTRQVVTAVLELVDR